MHQLGVTCDSVIYLVLQGPGVCEIQTLVYAQTEQLRTGSHFVPGQIAKMFSSRHQSNLCNMGATGSKQVQGQRQTYTHDQAQFDSQS